MSRPLKVMFLIDSYLMPYAGTEHQLLALVNGLKERGIETELALLRESGYIRDQGFPCPVMVLDIPRLASLSCISKLWSFSRYLRRNNFSILHTYFNDSSIAAPIFAKLSGVKVIISRRDMGFWYSSLKLVLLRTSRLFVDAVIANSEAVKSITCEKEWFNRKQIHVIYNGHSRKPMDSAVLTNTTLFPERQTTIGLVANIRPVKRIDLLIRAFAILKGDYKDSILVVIGAGDTVKLESLASEIGVAEDVYFTGGRDDTASLIQRFNVAVLCSESEGFSNSIVEYIDCGVPVVCTDVGGNPEIIVDGETGYLVAPDNPQALAEGIRKILQDPENARQLTIRAQQRVQAMCNYDSMIQSHISLYHGLIEGSINQ